LRRCAVARYFSTPHDSPAAAGGNSHTARSMKAPVISQHNKKRWTLCTTAVAQAWALPRHQLNSSTYPLIHSSSPPPPISPAWLGESWAATTESRPNRAQRGQPLTCTATPRPRPRPQLHSRRRSAPLPISPPPPTNFSSPPLINSSTHPLINLSTPPLINLSSYQLILSSTHPLIHSSSHPLILSSTPPLLHSSTPPLNLSSYQLILSSTSPLLHSSSYQLLHYYDEFFFSPRRNDATPA
jgi:hypothetical protein